MSALSARSIRRLTSRCLVVAILIASAVAATASSAHAGDCDWRLCGNVTNRDDRLYLRITNHWPQRENQSTWRWLKPGQDGPDIGVRDIDGFFIRHCVTMAWFKRECGPPRWYKVRNGQNVQVTRHQLTSSAIAPAPPVPLGRAAASVRRRAEPAPARRRPDGQRQAIEEPARRVGLFLESVLWRRSWMTSGRSRRTAAARSCAVGELAPARW